jgi:hypothetical protein
MSSDTQSTYIIYSKHHEYVEDKALNIEWYCPTFNEGNIKNIALKISIKI